MTTYRTRSTFIFGRMPLSSVESWLPIFSTSEDEHRYASIKDIFPMIPKRDRPIGKKCTTTTITSGPTILIITAVICVLSGSRFTTPGGCVCSVYIMVRINILPVLRLGNHSGLRVRAALPAVGEPPAWGDGQAERTSIQKSGGL